MHRVKRQKLSGTTTLPRRVAGSIARIARVKSRAANRGTLEARPAGEQAITAALYEQIRAAIKMNEPGAL